MKHCLPKSVFIVAHSFESILLKTNFEWMKDYLTMNPKAPWLAGTPSWRCTVFDHDRRDELDVAPAFDFKGNCASRKLIASGTSALLVFMAEPKRLA